MRINFDQFPSHLAGNLGAVYLISGDEPLLVMEAGDALRAAARQTGFSDRSVFHVDASFDWSQILLDSSSMSLFAEKKLIEIRMPTGKAGAAGSKVLEQLATQPPPDTLILVTTGKLDAGVRRSKWVKAFENSGVCLQVWPLQPHQLPQWIAQRMQARGLKAEKSAIELLAERVEGNLLAADQEISKLKLLTRGDSISAEDVALSVADSSRHDIFEFVDGALQQQTGRLAKILGHLRAEGIQVPVVLWAVARELRLLFFVSQAIERKQSPAQAMNQHQVWKSRQSLIASAAGRKGPGYWQSCLTRCMKIDRQAKGRADGNCWDELLQLGIRMARS